jgi:sporulation protein YlmC with PRC-barrel domain
MKRTNLLLAVVFAVSSFFVAPIAMAADTAEHQSMQKQTMSQDMFRASKMMDKSVKDQAGQNLGKIEDFAFGNEGRTTFVILSANDKFYPIPFQSLHQGAKQDEFVANFSKDKFANAPSFSKNEWQNFTSGQWDHQRVFSYYGEQPSQTGGQFRGQQFHDQQQSGQRRY